MLPLKLLDSSNFGSAIIVNLKELTRKFANRSDCLLIIYCPTLRKEDSQTNEKESIEEWNRPDCLRVGVKMYCNSKVGGSQTIVACSLTGRIQRLRANTSHRSSTGRTVLRI